MQPIVQTATTELIVDGEQAKKELGLVNEKIKDVDKQIRQARKAGDEQLVKSLKKQKDQLLSNRQALQKEAIEVNRILNSLSTAKPKELNATIKSLTKQLNDPAIKRGSEEWKYLNAQIIRCKKELNQVNAELQVGESRMNRWNNTFSKWGGMIASGIAALTGVSMALNSFREKKNAQEESRADLKALTGLDNDSIAWLENEAISLSTTVSESGIRIRQSATEILEAFKLVGSAKPELLEDKEALKEVTEQALILASASGMKLTDAVDGVTLALNQYGEGANQAARYVNVLAAGSKYGSAAVESQTRAIRGAGVAAAGANIPIEQLQGSIQTLAERGIKDEVAGTGLKKFFLTLQTGAKDTNPAIVGLSQALQTLSDKHLSAAQIKKQFGEEGYNVAKILIDSKDKVEQYTKAVTATNVANEQAAEKSNTVAASMATARNKLNQAGMEFVNTLNPAILRATNLTTGFISTLVRLPELFKLYWQWLVLATAVTVTYNAKTIASTAATWAKVAATKAQTVAQAALNVVTKANPIGLLVTVIGTVVAALITWYNHSIKVQAVTNALWSSIKEVGGRVADVFSGIWTIVKGGLWGNKDALLKAWDEGTTLIKQATNNMGKGIADAFWDSYNDTMKKGQAKAVKPKPVSPQGSPATSSVIYPDAVDPETAAKATKKAEQIRKKEKEAALEANKNLYNALKTQIQRQYLEEQINEATKNHLLEMMDMQSLEGRIGVLKKYGEDVSEEELKLTEKRIAALKKAKESTKFSSYIGNPEEEEADPELDRLIERTKRTYAYKKAALEDDYNEGLISQKEYQQQERELLEEHLEQMLSSRIGFANQVSQIASQASQLVSALSQREELAIENKYAAELKAAKGNATKTAALQEQMEEEKKAVKKKYADIDFAITAAQIVASTAASIMQLWVKPGFPAAIPLAALVGATGIAQLLLANEQRQQVKNLWTGGYTGPGNWDEPQGIVHSDEFVGNRFAVRNKAVNKVFKMIDVAQKNNTIAKINETDIIRALGGLSMENPNVDPVYQQIPSEPDPYLTEALYLLSTTIKDLKKQMQDGTLARTYVSGDGGTKSARDKYDKMLKNVTRYTKKS